VEKVAPKNYAYRPFELSLFYPVCIFHPRHKVIIGLSLNILHGRSTSAYGLEIGGIVNHEIENFGGIQLAGIVNYVSGTAAGIQLAGIVNFVRRDVYGLQLSLVNWVGGSCYGLCISPALNLHGGVGGILLSSMNWVGKKGGGGLLLGGVNLVEGNFKGIQISPIVNVNYRHFTGLQISLMNFNNRKSVRIGCSGNYCTNRVTTFFADMNGLQLSLANMAYNIYGVQLSGILNVAFNKMHGWQLSPLFNMAGPVRGVQISAVNYATHLRGLQIGLINITGRLSGVQLGAINIAYKNKFPFMVGVLVGAN